MGFGRRNSVREQLRGLSLDHAVAQALKEPVLEHGGRHRLMEIVEAKIVGTKPNPSVFQTEADAMRYVTRPVDADKSQLSPQHVSLLSTREKVILGIEK